MKQQYSTEWLLVKEIVKLAIIIIVSLVGLIIMWFNLPINIRYANKIYCGNKFVENIRLYEKANKRLPNKDEWEVLEKLNPLKPYKTFYPDYLKIDDTNFVLTYLEGFDSPYLTYDSITKKWEMK